MNYMNALKESGILDFIRNMEGGRAEQAGLNQTQRELNIEVLGLVKEQMEMGIDPDDAVRNVGDLVKMSLRDEAGNILPADEISTNLLAIADSYRIHLDESLETMNPSSAHESSVLSIVNGDQEKLTELLGTEFSDLHVAKHQTDFHFELNVQQRVPIPLPE